MDTKMQGIIGMAIGVLTLVVVFIIVPLVGYNMEAAVTIGTTSQWNSTVNTAVPTAVKLWTSVAGIIQVAAIITIIGSFLRVLQGLRE